MRLSEMTMRGILFSSSLTPKAFLLEFIQIGFSVMQTASLETGSSQIFPEWNGGWRCGKHIALSTIEMDTEYTNTCLVDTNLSADTRMVIFPDRAGQATKGHGSFAKSGCNFLIWCGVFWVLSLGMWTFLRHLVYVLTNKRNFLQISNHYYLPHSGQDPQVAIKTIFNGRSPQS